MKWKFALSASVSIIVSSCAFKPEAVAPQTLTESSETGLSLTADWNSSTDREPESTLKARRTLLTGANSEFAADSPITVPGDVPTQIALSADLPDRVMTEGVEFLRAYVEGKEGRREIHAQWVHRESGEGERKRALFHILGLNTVLSSEQSAFGSLKVELFSPLKRIATVEVPVRTPPSKIDVSLSTPTQWMESGRDKPEVLRAPVVNGTRLNLIRVITLSNQEELPVVVSLPRRPQASLFQWENPMVHQDLGCRGPGYRIDESPRNTQLAQELVVFPMERDFLPEAEKTLKSPNLRGSVTTVIAAGSEARFGIYAIGEGAKRWLDQGPLQAEVRQIEVPTTCYDECVQMECERGGRPYLMSLESSMKEGDLQLNPMGCHCAMRATRRRRTQVTVGVNRGAVQLRFSPNQQLFSARFGDLTSDRDGEIRLLPYSEADSTAQR